MNQEMTKAILEGRKTQTRRVGITASGKYIIDENLLKNYKLSNQDISKCGKYQKGNIVWVREPVSIESIYRDDDTYDSTKIKYIADGKVVDYFEMPEKHIDKKWHINCQGVPNGCIKEMARIFLEITDVRVEKIQDISDNDIFKDGFSDFVIVDGLSRFSPKAPKRWWKNLWDKTAPKGYKWDDNPYVFVYSFKIVTDKEDIKLYKFLQK